MPTKENLDTPEHGISKTLEKKLEKYLISHKDGQIPNGLYQRIINEVDRAILTITMKHANGNKMRAANILGINRNTLRKKMLKTFDNNESDNSN